MLHTAYFHITKTDDDIVNMSCQIHIYQKISVKGALKNLHLRIPAFTL